MSQYESACDVICDTEYGPAGGYREYSYASWCWDAIMDILGQAATADDMWDLIGADIEGAYFSEEYGEKDLGGGISVCAERIADTDGAFDTSYLRFIRDGQIVMELSAESDNETDMTSGISVLCDNLFERINS